MTSFRLLNSTKKSSYRMYYAILASLLFLLLMGCERPEPPTSSIKLKGNLDTSFSLKDPDGKQVSISDFKGKAVLLFFGFVHCPDVCPTALSRAAQVKTLLGPDADRLQVIFVSLDPERDSPQILREYTAAFGKDFIGLTADEETIKKTAKEFGVYYAKVQTQVSYTIDHSTTSYLYDAVGKIDAVVLAEASAEEVARDVKRVLK